VQARGSFDQAYYPSGANPRTAYGSERLPTLPPPSQPYSSSTASPRVSSIGSVTSSNSDSQSSFSSAPSSNGPKTPPSAYPVSHSLAGQSAHSAAGYESYPAMNPQGPPDMYYQHHMSAGQTAPPQTVTSGAMSYHHPHQPLLPPAQAQYPAPPTPYNGFQYPNGLTSPPTGPPPPSASMANPAVTLPLPTVQLGPPQNQYQGFDTTGQIAPPGMKPRVTATLWEDEGSLCFQVEARGICVARREGQSFLVPRRFGHTLLT
jgi:enhanced filamentous growth protein 1